MGSYQKLDQPLPTIQEVPEAELEARERRLRDREADLEARERRLQELEDMERRYQALQAGAASGARGLVGAQGGGRKEAGRHQVHGGCGGGMRPRLGECAPPPGGTLRQERG